MRLPFSVAEIARPIGLIAVSAGFQTIDFLGCQSTIQTCSHAIRPFPSLAIQLCDDAQRRIACTCNRGAHRLWRFAEPAGAGGPRDRRAYDCGPGGAQLPTVSPPMGTDFEGYFSWRVVFTFSMLILDRTSSPTIQPHSTRESIAGSSLVEPVDICDAHLVGESRDH